MLLADELEAIIASTPASDEVRARHWQRLKEGALTTSENPVSHFTTHFTPYDPQRGSVFIVDHKKAQTWLFPGGHIEGGESLLDTLNREIKEELGMSLFFTQAPRPFFLTTKAIDNVGRPCKEHLDIWFLMETDGKNFHVDMDEFYDAQWMSFDDARRTLTDTNNLAALDRIVAHHETS